MKTILVTGGAGFIGANFVRMVLNEHPDAIVVNLAAQELSEAASEESQALTAVTNLEGHIQFHFAEAQRLLHDARDALVREKYTEEQLLESADALGKKAHMPGNGISDFDDGFTDPGASDEWLAADGRMAIW